MTLKPTKRKLSSLIYRHSQAAKNSGEIRTDLLAFGKKIQTMKSCWIDNEETPDSTSLRKQENAIDMCANEGRRILCNRIRKIAKSTNKFEYSNRLLSNKPEAVAYVSSLQTAQAKVAQNRTREIQRGSSVVKSLARRSKCTITVADKKELYAASEVKSSIQNHEKFGGGNFWRMTSSQRQQACKPRSRLFDSAQRKCSRGNSIEKSMDLASVNNQNLKQCWSNLEKKISFKVNQIRASAKYKNPCSSIYRESEHLDELQVGGQSSGFSELRFFSSNRIENDRSDNLVKNISINTGVSRVGNCNPPSISNDLANLASSKGQKECHDEEYVNNKRNMNAIFANSIAKLDELSSEIDRATKFLDSSFSHRTAALSIGETISTNRAILERDLEESCAPTIASNKIGDGILLGDILDGKLPAQLIYNGHVEELREQLNETASFIRQFNISSESIFPFQCTSKNEIHNGSYVVISSDDIECVATKKSSPRKQSRTVYNRSPHRKSMVVDADFIELNGQNESIIKAAGCSGSRILLHHLLSEERESSLAGSPFDERTNIVSYSLGNNSEDGDAMIVSAENMEDLQCLPKFTSQMDLIEANIVSEDRGFSDTNEAVAALHTSLEYSSDDYGARVASSLESAFASNHQRFLPDKLKRRMLIDRVVAVLRQYYIDVIEYFHVLRRLLARSGRVADAKKMRKQGELMEGLCLSLKKSILGTITDQCSFEVFQQKNREEILKIDFLRRKVRCWQSMLLNQASLSSSKLVGTFSKRQLSDLPASTGIKQKNEQTSILLENMDDKWKKHCSAIDGASSLPSQRIYSLVRKLHEKRDEAILLQKRIDERTYWHSLRQEKSLKAQIDAYEHYISETINDLLEIKNLYSEAGQNQVSYQKEESQVPHISMRNVNRMSVSSIPLPDTASSHVESTFGGQYGDHTFEKMTFPEICASFTSVKSEDENCDSTNVSGKSGICSVPSCCSGSTANHKEIVEELPPISPARTSLGNSVESFPGSMDRLAQSIISPVAEEVLDELLTESLHVMIPLIRNELVTSVNAFRRNDSMAHLHFNNEIRAILKTGDKSSSSSESLLNDASWLDGCFDLNKILTPRELFKIPNLDLAKAGTGADTDNYNHDCSVGMSIGIHDTAIAAECHLTSTRNNLENFDILNAEHETELRDLLTDYVHALEWCLAENQPIAIAVQEFADENNGKFQCRLLLADLCCEVCTDLLRSPSRSSQMLGCNSLSSKQGRLYSLLEREMLIPILKGSFFDDDFGRQAGKCLDPLNRIKNCSIENLVVQELRKCDTKCEYDEYEERIVCELANELLSDALHESFNILLVRDVA